MKNRLIVIAIAIVALGGIMLSSDAAVTRSSSPGSAISNATNPCTGTDGAGGVTDTIAYPEAGVAMTDVNVRTEIDHTWRGDLQFHVSYDNGSTTALVVLAADHDGSADGYYATFDDEAATDCATTCGAAGACEAGTPADCQPDSPLSAFDGLMVPGTFTMQVCDDAGGDDGTFQLWETTVDGPPPIPVELIDFNVTDD